jgi:hypothetical protein
MPFNTQQVNVTSVVLDKLKALKSAYYDLLEANEALKLLTIPPVTGADSQPNYPPAGELNHLDNRGKLVMASGVCDALVTWMNTAIDLDGAGGAANKKPLDAIVDALRTV